MSRRIYIQQCHGSRGSSSLPNLVVRHMGFGSMGPDFLALGLFFPVWAEGEVCALNSCMVYHGYVGPQ